MILATTRGCCQRMLDFDYASRRETPSVAAIINPTGADSFAKFFFGTHEILIPIYKTIEKAAKMHPNADVMINFASYRSAAPSTEEALAIPQLRTIVIIAEGVSTEGLGLAVMNRLRKASGYNIVRVP